MEKAFGIEPSRTEWGLMDKSLLLEYGGDKMQVTKTERYVKVDDIQGKQDVKFKILDEPIEVNGTYGKKLECKIKYEDTNAKWGINNMSKDILIDGLGANTEDWIGKEIQVHVKTINNKKAIIVNKEQF